MTSCKFNFFKRDSSTEDVNTIDLSKYEEYKDREWFNIGLEQETDYFGNNTYFNAIIKYEKMKKGKYTANDGSYNLYICDNGDVVRDNANRPIFFNKTEYRYYKAYVSDRSYEPSTVGLTGKEALYAFYYELASLFDGITESKLSYQNSQFASMDAAGLICGKVIKDKRVGTVETDDKLSYICQGVSGVGASFDESYVFTTYMNSNSLFKFVGLPPFLSASTVTSWKYGRKYGTTRNLRIWHDDELTINLDGYSKSEIRSWAPLFELAGYGTTSLEDHLDDTTSPYFTYKATIKILGYTTNESDGESKYLKNNIKLVCAPSKFDTKNNPIEYSVSYTIDFANATIWDGCGTFEFEDTGLNFYYTDDGIQYVSKIVGSSGTLETDYLIKNEIILTFFFPNKGILD